MTKSYHSTNWPSADEVMTRRNDPRGCSVSAGDGSCGLDRSCGLDDIIDLIQDVAHTVNLYNVRHVTAEAVNLSVLCRSCCERVRAAVLLLPSMDNAAQILKICHEIDQLESAADREMRSAMSKVFREEPDVRELIKYKAIYELLEVVTDRCEDVANLIEGIVLENS